MKIWMRLMGICFLAMFVVGCAAKERGPSPKSTYSSPEIVEKDITPKSTKVESTAQEQVVSKPRAKVTAHRLNLRENASTNSRILGVLKKGDVLVFISKIGEWVQVHNENSLSGWVSGRYTEPIDGISNPKAKDEAQAGKKARALAGKKDLKSTEPSIKASEKPASPTGEVEFSDDVVDRFFHSILDGDIETVQGFLVAGMSPNVRRPGFGHSPLYTAASSRQDEISLMLIEKGANVNFRDEYGTTPLMWAAENCKSDPLVKALVNVGADINAKARGGGTALTGAQVHKCDEIVRILIKAGAK